MAALVQRSSLGARVAAARPASRCRPTGRVLVSQRPQLAGVQTAAIAGPVTDDTFDELVLKSSVPVLVDFWAPWCGPCRMIAPIVDEIANEYNERLTCVKLNTDESPQVATEYGIRSIPTVMIFKNGKKMDTIIGAVPKATLTQTVDKYLN